MVRLIVGSTHPVTPFEEIGCMVVQRDHVVDPPESLFQHPARPQDFAVLLGKLGDLLRRDYDTSQQLAGLPPTLLVAGDSDSFSPAHAVEFFVRLGGGQRDGGWDGSSRPASQLAILPGTTHYDLFTSAALVPTVLPFLGSHTHAQSAAQ